MKRILVISQIYPYPLHDGGRVDVYHRLQVLHALGYKITLVAFYNPNLPDIDRKPLEDICESVYPIPYLRRQFSKLIGLRPYSISSRENLPAIHEVIQEIKGNTFDSILAESHHVLTVAWKFKSQLSIPKLFLRVHNNEPKFMLSVAQTSPLISITRPFFLYEAAKYFFYDKILMRRFSPSDELLHISFDEMRSYKKKYPKFAHHFLPAAVELPSLKPYKEFSNKKVLFVGALFSPNNLQGLKWYIENVHPSVIEKIPDYTLVVAGNTRGANKDTLQKLFASLTNFEFHDTPDNLDPIYQESSVFINPMRDGAGVKLKTIQALLNGMPIVSTTIGNEGTGLTPDKHILVTDQDKKFAEAVITLLENPKKQSEMVEAGQQFLRKQYNQREVLSKLFHTQATPETHVITI